MNPAAQWTTIGWMIVCGILMGTTFDIYRVVCRRFRVPRWLLPVLDLAFWAAATLGVFGVLLRSNHGEVRLYVFLGLGIGVTGYFGLFSSRVVKAAAWLLNALIVLSGWLWKMFRLLVAAPIFGIVRLLARLLDIAFVITAALVIGLVRIVLIPLKPIGRFIWRKMLPVRRAVRNWIEECVRVIGIIKAAWKSFRKKN